MVMPELVRSCNEGSRLGQILDPDREVAVLVDNQVKMELYEGEV